MLSSSDRPHPINPLRARELERFVQKLGLPAGTTPNWHYLDLALTHPSASAEANYERLEFVGDAVVRLVAAELLLENYPEDGVGDYAALRSMMVSDRILAELAAKVDLERYLILSSSAAANPAGVQSRLADAFEAVLGALYLSTHNMQLVRPWLDSLLLLQAEIVRHDPARLNYKDALQEWTQATHRCLPVYKLVEAEESFYNDPERFTAEIWLQDRCLGSGKGRSKKRAEQAAAKQAFFLVQSVLEPDE
ncbi:MAG: ribonuclease III [Cyanobacteria bacterium J06641_5]